MKGKKEEIHWTSKDIVQKLLLFNLPMGSEPLAMLGVKTGKIVGVEPTDIVAVKTIDDAADILFRLENNVILHIEMQTNYNKNDIYRFNQYDAYLLNNKYRKEKNLIIKTIVIFTHNVNPEKVVSSFDRGSVKYEYEPVFLKDKDGDAYFHQIKDKILKDPNYTLSPEEQLILLYVPLMETTESFEDCILAIADLVNHLKDERQKFSVVGTMLAFHRKKISKEVGSKLWEVLEMAETIFEEFEKSVVEKALKEGQKLERVNNVQGLLEEKVPDETIMKALNLSPKELKDIKRSLKNN